MVSTNAKAPLYRRAVDYRQRRFTGEVRFNTYKNENGFELHLAVPGIDKEGLSVDTENGLLVVTHKAANHSDLNAAGCIQCNFDYSGFTKRFNLPENVDTEAIRAAYENGVLRITLPVKEKFQKKNITVN